MESLLKVVGNTQEASSGPTLRMRSTHADREVRVYKLSEDDNIEAYLTTFERMMVAFEVPRGIESSEMPLS